MHAAATWQVLAATLFGSVVGLIFGAIPGLTYSMALAMVLPLTFGMGNEAAIAAMLSTYIGGMTGGAISAILIGVPGTPSAAATVFDGHMMAKNNQASLAIGTATVAAGIGGILSLRHHADLGAGAGARRACLRPGRDHRAGHFRTVDDLRAGGKIAGARHDRRRARADGHDHRARTRSTAWQRFTFGTVTMLQGVDLLVAMIGLFAVPHAIRRCATWRRGAEAKVEAQGGEGRIADRRA